MKSKVDKLKRIEKLQKRMHDLSRWRLATLARERDALATAHSQMLEALGEGLMSFGGAAAAGTRRIRSLELEMVRADLTYETQAKETFDRAVRSKTAERALDSARTEHRHELEKKSLSELIEWSLQSRDSGSHKP